MLAVNAYKSIIFDSVRGSGSYLEIGSYDGEGIAMLSNAFPDKKFYSIDPFIEDGNTSAGTGVKKGDAIGNIRKAFLSNTSECLNLYHFDITSLEFIKEGLYDKIDVDVIFIDGDHSFEAAFMDLNLALLFSMNKNIIVIMDDYYNEEVNKAVELFNKIHDIKINIIEEYGVIHFNLPQ